jgi:hypothetical protein
MPKAPKRPRDLNEWAKRMVDIATGEVSDREPTPEEQGKTRPPSHLGARAVEGGAARAATLSPEQRKATAQKAAVARWKK